MDWVSWVIIAAVIVFAAAALAIWNRAMRRSRFDPLDDAGRREVLEAQRRVEQSKSDLGNIGGAGMG